MSRRSRSASFVLITTLSFGGLVAACGVRTPQQPVPVTTPTFQREVRGGRYLAAQVAPFAQAADVDVSGLFPASVPDLQQPLGSLTASDFSEVTRADGASVSGSKLAYVSLRQTVNGIPI